MKTIKTYHHSHLFVSAIRILDHQKSAPPSIEEVCSLLDFSLEQGHFICNKLAEMEIVKIVEGAYGMRLFIKNHTLLEDIPISDKESKLDEALKQFKATRKGYEKARKDIPQSHPPAYFNNSPVGYDRLAGQNTHKSLHARM